MVHPYTKVLITKLEKKGDLHLVSALRRELMESKETLISKYLETHLETLACTRLGKGVGCRRRRKQK